MWNGHVEVEKTFGEIRSDSNDNASRFEDTEPQQLLTAHAWPDLPKVRKAEGAAEEEAKGSMNH